MASHLTPELWYTEEFMVDSITARCPGPVAAEQAQITSTPPLLLTVGVCADMLRLVFSKRAAVHYDQTSPLWSRLSKGHCSRSLGVC